MKTRIFFLALAIVCAGLAQAQSGNYILREDFSSNTNGWLQEKTDKYNFTVAAGKYYCHSSGGNWFSTIPVNMTGVEDFELSFKLRKIGGTDGFYFGVRAGLDTKTGYYHLVGITGNGDFVLANKGAYPSDIIRSEKNDFVRRGNSENKIVLRRQNGYFTLFINGTKAGVVKAEKLYGSNFGVELWSGNEVLDITLDDLTITKL
ncbi:MAG: hypothetical protein EOO15_09220 [Chitinophagaceae bacterium]|nr:MAG: hypothetical protein EOO15_09220 [Chitinophagaceae bacterium]